MQVLAGLLNHMGHHTPLFLIIVKYGRCACGQEGGACPVPRRRVGMDIQTAGLERARGKSTSVMPLKSAPQLSN